MYSRSQLFILASVIALMSCAKPLMIKSKLNTIDIGKTYLTSMPSQYDLFQINFKKVKKMMADQWDMNLPVAIGKTAELHLIKNTTISEDLAKKYPNIHTYQGTYDNGTDTWQLAMTVDTELETIKMDLIGSPGYRLEPTKIKNTYIFFNTSDPNFKKINFE